MQGTGSVRGDAIRAWRTGASMSQEELARHLEYDRSMVSNWETGRNDVSNELLIQVAKATGRSLDDVKRVLMAEIESQAGPDLPASPAGGRAPEGAWREGARVPRIGGLPLTRFAGRPMDAMAGVDGRGGYVKLNLLEDGPCWLVAGQRGSGRAVAVHALLLSLMACHGPDSLRVTWVDTRRVESAHYGKSPYCPVGSVTDAGDAAGFLRYLCWEARRRAAAGGRDFPCWVVVIDDWGRLSAEHGDTVARDVCELVAAGREARICLLLCSSLVTEDTYPVSLRETVGARIVFRLDTEAASELMVGHAGAADLMGHGDALVVRAGGGAAERVRFPFASDEEIALALARGAEEHGPAARSGRFLDGAERRLAYRDWAGASLRIDYKRAVADPSCPAHREMPQGRRPFEYAGGCAPAGDGPADRGDVHVVPVGGASA